MAIEKFNVFSKTVSGKGSGVGEIIDDKLVAINFDAPSSLVIGEHVFPIAKHSIKIEYQNINKQTLGRILIDNKEVMKASYPAWFTQQAVVAGLGMADDEDEDFIAYLKVLLENPTRFKALEKRYRDKALS
jgi:hypothetical protein